MAHGLKFWLGGLVLGCGVIAAAYLPARGMEVLPLVGGSFGRWERPRQSEIAQRRAALAEQFKIVDAQIQAMELRQQADPILAARRAAGEGPRAAVFAQDSTMAERQRLMAPAFDSAWSQLQLDDAKVAIVLASPSRLRSNGDTPSSFSWWKTYVLPDSTDRTTCVIVYPTAMFGNEKPRPSVVEQRMRVGMGPCAFYARFGIPGPRVRRWLQANNFDVAESGDWSNVERYRDQDFDDDSWQQFVGDGTIWYYATIYSYSFNTVACMAGREKACVEGLRRGDREDGAPFRRVFTPGERWRNSEQRVPRVSSFLATVFKEVGENAFQEFWTTSLPVDSALSIALEQPVGEWLAKDRVRNNDFQIQLGPIPPWPAMVIPSVVALTILGLAAVAVTRRQVR